MNLKIFCRICLEAPNALQTLNLDKYCDEERDLSYRDCLNILTGIKIPENEENPANLCCICGEELKIAYNFYKKIKEANQILDEMKITSNDNSMPDELPTSTVALTIEKDYLPFRLEESVDSYGTPTQVYIDKLDSEEDLNAEIQVEFIEIEPTKLDVLENHDISSPIDNIEIQASEASADEFETDSLEVEYLLEEDPKPEDKLLASEEILETDQCTTSQKSQESLTKKKRTMNRKQIHKCEFCDKVFNNNSRLLQHKSCHDPTRPLYSCLDCHRLYSTKGALEAHRRIVHEKKGYVCPYCQKIFAIRKGLEIHMRYHTGDFPFNCTQCDKKFAQMCHLNTHIKVTHNNKRFTCEFPNCSKVFTNSASLRNHEFSHGTKPFKCAFCKNEYPCKAKLKVHIRRKHDREMSLEELESMRQFYNQRSRLKMVEVEPIESKT